MCSDRQQRKGGSVATPHEATALENAALPGVAFRSHLLRQPALLHLLHHDPPVDESYAAVGSELRWRHHVDSRQHDIHRAAATNNSEDFGLSLHFGDRSEVFSWGKL